MTCLEMGTCLAISTGYQSAALELNERGRLVTLEGAASLAARATANLQFLGLDRTSVVIGRFQDTLAEVLCREAPIDYAFIDGHHDKDATVAYFLEMLPYLAGNALLVFDDIAWSPGMTEAWRWIVAHPRVATCVDLSNVGICVLSESCQEKRGFKLALDRDSL